MARGHKEEELKAGPLRVFPAGYTARANGSVIPLTPREFELLVELMRRPDEVLARTWLYEQCWGHEMDPADRAVDVYVRKLRAKLDNALPGWTFIHTHYRLGYRFSPQEHALDGEDAAGTSLADAELRV